MFGLTTAPRAQHQAVLCMCSELLHLLFPGAELPKVRISRTWGRAACALPACEQRGGEVLPTSHTLLVCGQHMYVVQNVGQSTGNLPVLQKFCMSGCVLYCCGGRPSVPCVPAGLCIATVMNAFPRGLQEQLLTLFVLLTPAGHNSVWGPGRGFVLASVGACSKQGDGCILMLATEAACGPVTCLLGFSAGKHFRVLGWAGGILFATAVRLLHRCTHNNNTGCMFGSAGSILMLVFAGYVGLVVGRSASWLAGFWIGKNGVSFRTAVGSLCMQATCTCRWGLCLCGLFSSGSCFLASGWVGQFNGCFQRAQCISGHPASEGVDAVSICAVMLLGARLRGTYVRLAPPSQTEVCGQCMQNMGVMCWACGWNKSPHSPTLPCDSMASNNV